MYAIMFLISAGLLIAGLVQHNKGNPIWKKIMAGSAVAFVAFIFLVPPAPPPVPVSAAPPVAPVAKPVPAPAPEDTAKEKCEQIIKDAAKSQLKKVTVIVQADGGLIPEVQLIGKENLTIAMIRKGIFLDCADMFEKIYTSGLPVKEVRETIFMPMKDKYGNSSDAEVARMTLKKETAAKVNWKNVEKIEFDKVADHIWVHPALYKD